MSRFIYISGPITGNDDYLKEFEFAEQYLHDLDPDIVTFNPAAAFGAGGLSDADYRRIIDMEKDLICRFDAIFLLDGWEQSQGAREELKIALDEGMDIFKDKDPDLREKFIRFSKYISE